MTDLLSELRLTVTQCFHSTVRTDWRGRDQADGDTRIYLPLRGRAELSWAGRRFRLQPGRCFLIPAHRPRTFSCSGRLELWWTHCQLKLWGGVDAWRYLQAVGEIEADLGVWHARFADLARYWRDSTPAGRLASDGIARRMLSDFLPDVRSDDAPLTRFRPVLTFIEAHLAETITVARLAEVAGLAPDRFARDFRAALHETPMRLLRRRRVERAQALLRTGRLTLEQVAEQTGFYDGFHLSRVFTRHVGQSPRAWRAAVKQERP